MFESFAKFLGRSPLKSLGLWASLALGAGYAAPAQAQNYGARIFWLAPKDVSAVQFQVLSIESNTSFSTDIVFPNLNINTTAVVPTFVHNFDLAGQAAQAAVSIPYAWVNVALSTDSRGINREQKGFADLYAHLRVGLVNAPALSPEEFVAYLGQDNPPVIIHGLLGLYAPTGDYSDKRVVNIGTNRWTFRGAIPVVIRLSENWRPGQRSTLEIIPGADLFTNNNSPSFSNSQFLPDTTSQSAVFRLESHLTQDLDKNVFISLDSYAVFGGETAGDGVGNNNAQSWLAIGGTLGGNPWPNATVSVNGGTVVTRNKNSPDGWQLRLMLIQAF
jgi:hypothetical protein